MLKDTKSRVILIIAVVLFLLIALFVYFQVREKEGEEISKFGLKSGPSVTSIPGARTATTEYKKAVEEQNIKLAEEAAKQGEKSAVPTLTEATYLGARRFPGQQIASPECNPDELRKARASGVRAEELRCKGCSPSQLKVAGYTAGELKEAGFTSQQLKAADFSSAQLKDAGFNATELKKAGLKASELKTGGFNAKELKEAGFSPADLKAGAYTAQELKQAGYTTSDLEESGFSPAEVTAARAIQDFSKQPGFPKDCSPEALKKALNANISAQQIKQQLNCDVKSLKTAGYDAESLKKAGFSAGELKDAGFSPGELKTAGFIPEELRNAGFTAAQLKDAGFSPDELKKAGFSRGDLLRAGYTPSELKEVATSPLSENFPKDCSPEALKRASAANVPVSEIRRALGCNANSLHSAGYAPKQLIDGGFTVDELKKAGLPTPIPTPSPQIVGPVALEFPKDCTPESLAKARSLNISAEKIKQVLNCDVKVLKEAIYPVGELKKAGFTAGQLKAAGFSNEDLLQAGFVPEEIKAASSLLEGQGIPGVTSGAGQMPSIPPDRQAQFLADLRKRQMEQLSDQQRQAALQQLQQAMTTQASDLLASWSPPTTQTFVLVPDEKVAVVDKDHKGGRRSRVRGDVVKAGTVMFGVLDTGINSDQDSPILATIIQGKLKGAKLIGNFTRREERVIVSFQTINLPELKNTIGVNAVAIDADEARTALASRVDNHYFLRYGSLFASSFVSGLSSAIIQSGSVISSNANTGFVVQATPKLNTGEKVLVALGNVGQQYSSVLSKNFTVPPTVYVDPGAGIGVLFMQDLTIPENEEELDVLLTQEELKNEERRKEERAEVIERADMERRGYKESAPQVIKESAQQVFIPRP